MPNIWLSPHFMHRFSTWYKSREEQDAAVGSLYEILKAASEPEDSYIETLPEITSGILPNSLIEWKASYFDVLQTVILFDFRRPTTVPEDLTRKPSNRALLLPSDVVQDWISNKQMWSACCKGLYDAANIDQSKKQPEEYKAVGVVSSLFLPVKNVRMHMADRPGIGLNVVLGDFNSLLWASHPKTANTIKQPTGGQLATWDKLHQQIMQRHNKVFPKLVWKVGAPAVMLHVADIEDTWISKEQLEDIEITDLLHIKAIMQCQSDDDLIQLMDVLNDKQWLNLEMLRIRHLTQRRRQEEQAVGSIAQYELNRSSHSEDKNLGYEGWVELLTPAQKEVVTKPLQIPIRLKGGPGTGKTLTAIMRAAYLLQHARDNGYAFHVGFIVFNRDLGLKVYQQFADAGFTEFLNEYSPQRLTVTSLMEWCEGFLNLEARGIEPIAPYRADRIDQQRQALFQLTVDEAHSSLNGPEYDPLWSEFDTRSKQGLREIETEISQFIKARAIPTLQTYLNERRPTGWLRDTDKEYRRFVWEVYQTYDQTLRKLRMIDADDLVNDCFRQVSQTLWQNYEKEKFGFDYLILDEAHDFFRHQIHLLGAIVKDERNIMMCFDQGQMVYSRYPTLREMGHDTNERFFIQRLEVNFRNSKQILAALRALTAAHPVYDYNALWGPIDSNPKSPDGPKPQSIGFVTDTGMRKAVGDIIVKHLDNGVEAREIAVIGFDGDVVKSVDSTLVSDFGLKTFRQTGQGRQTPRNSIVVTTAKQVKGQQFDVCLLVGTDRDSLPDFRGGQGEVWSAQKREDDFRLLAVAMSRCKRQLHFIWHGTRPSEFIEAMGDTIEHKG
ncbi:MAG: UvrD-helicase domain-containing protein [Chloroflexi bacterium]|nr:UvrD-helicase domain-containing protein [Chloroflexota bacterium]